MNEQEISALIDELLGEKRAKRGTAAPMPAPEPDDAEREPVSHAAEPVSHAAEPVSHAAEPVSHAAEPVSHAAEPVSHAAEPVSHDAEPDEESPPDNDSAEAEPAPLRVPDAEERRRRFYAALNTQPEAEEQAAPPRKYRSRDVLAGIVLVLLAAYGVYALVLRGIDRANALRQNSAAMDAASASILPLVITDIPEFADPGELTDEQFMITAIWTAITQGKLSNYNAAFEMCSVPSADLTALGNQLLGVNRSPVHRTIAFSGEIRFYYDAETDSYLLPSDPELFTYRPVIRSMEQNDAGQYTVTADYVAEQPAWKQTEPLTVKTMQFTLEERSGIWQVRAARPVQ